MTGDPAASSPDRRPTEWTVVESDHKKDDGYDLVRQILFEAGGDGYISSYLSAFKKEEADDDALVCLESADDLKSGGILTKTGPRVKFWKALTSYKKSGKKEKRQDVDFVENLLF